MLPSAYALFGSTWVPSLPSLYLQVLPTMVPGHTLMNRAPKNPEYGSLFRKIHLVYPLCGRPLPKRERVIPSRLFVSDVFIECLLSEPGVLDRYIPAHPGNPPAAPRPCPSLLSSMLSCRLNGCILQPEKCFKPASVSGESSYSAMAALRPGLQCAGVGFRLIHVVLRWPDATGLLSFPVYWDLG